MNTTYDNYVYYRNKSGLSDYKISNLAGVSKSTLSDWKTGKHHPHNKTLKKLADVLEIDVNAFYNSVPGNGSESHFETISGSNLDAINCMDLASGEITYIFTLQTGERIELNRSEYQELSKAVNIFVESWIRTQKKI